MLMIAGIAFGLSGCGSSVTVVEDSNDDLVTLFLIDEDGYSIADVPYRCVLADGSIYDDTTNNDGSFSFELGDYCTFDFYDFAGSDDEPIFIEDDLGYGKGDIRYDCDSGDSGFTYSDGSFYYSVNDSCTFYF
jgi:hypothetical protein